MGVVSSIAGGVVSSILQSNVINRLADLIPDPQARQRALQDFETQLTVLVGASDVSQGPVNAAEASNALSLFISGWRPFIGWVCGSAFAYHFIILPFLLFIFTLTGHPVMLPQFDMQTLITVLMGMLGLGALRTVEKVTAMRNQS